MEQKLSSPDGLFRNFHIQTPNTHAYVTELNAEYVAPLVAKTSGFIDKTSRQMGAEFLRRFDFYQKSIRGSENPAIQDYLVANGLHLPQFAVFDADAGRVFLDEAGFTEEGIDRDHLLMVFQFPKPLAQFWKKRQTPFDREELSGKRIKSTIRTAFDRKIEPVRTDRSVRILTQPPMTPGPRVIEWGKFIPPLRRIIWDNIDLYSEKSHELEFDKINGNGDHEVDLYHYMWEVAFPNAKSGKK